MPVTLQSVFNACASDTISAANAEPVVVFIGGSLHVDSYGGKLVVVYFRPYLPAVTSFEDVALHIHTKPYEGRSGINVRAKNAPTGVVGSGIGKMAHGESVDTGDSKYPFYLKLKRDALKYIKSQLLAYVNSGKNLVSPQHTMTLAKQPTDESRMNIVWGLHQFWEKATAFSTQAVVLSPAAEEAKQKKQAESSIASVQIAAQLHQNPIINSVLMASGAFDD